MLDVLLTASVSFIISFLAIPVILQIADQKKLYDVPDERKVHTHPVASLGGVGIFGLEAQPNTEVPSLITATFFNGGNLLGTIPINVNGSGGARLFAAQTTGQFTRVSLTSTDDFAIARLRYGNFVATAAAPEPGVLPLVLSVGLLHAAGRHRRKQRK